MASFKPETASPGFSDRLAGWRRTAAERPLLILLGLLVVLVLITNLASPGFLLPGNFSTTLLIAGPLGMLAAGQTVVVLTGGIDLSITATATIAAFFLAQYGGGNGAVAVLGALGIGLLVGVINGIGVGPFRVPPLIMTLGVSGIITGLLTVWSTSASNTPRGALLCAPGGLGQVAGLPADRRGGLGGGHPGSGGVAARQRLRAGWSTRWGPTP